MQLVSYAQNYEDVILWRALRDVEQGFYVDVGAADPEEYSVTRAFYERGWSGPEGHATHLYRWASRNDPGYFGQLALPRTLSAVTGACAAIRRAVFFEVGGFEEVNHPVTFNDVDLCLRLGDYGYRVLWTPFAKLFHLECASRGSEIADPAKGERFLREQQHMRTAWGSLVESADPFHNPNLLFAGHHFEIPSLPRRKQPWRSVFEQVFNLKQRFALTRDVA